MPWILNDPPPKFGAELAECQRYYSDQIINTWIPLVNDSTGLHQLPVKYPVTMRAVPTTTLLAHDGTVITSVTVATKNKDYAVLSANANATVYRIINNADL